LEFLTQAASRPVRRPVTQEGNIDGQIQTTTSALVACRAKVTANESSGEKTTTEMPSPLAATYNASKGMGNTGKKDILIIRFF
jgi:hypothetical protein